MWLFFVGLALIFAVSQGGGTVARALEPVDDEDFYDNGAPQLAKLALGRLLFFDKILSGNRNIACATCHHPRFASADGLALPLGEGGRGIGTEREVGASQPVIDHVPRNTQALFNLGAREFTRLFHDGRVALDPDRYWRSGFRSPAVQVLPTGLDNVLAAQAMFPVASEIEMAGHEGENPIADAAAIRGVSAFTKVWDLLAQRLRAVPEYVDLFKTAYPEIARPDNITLVDAANAIAAFEAVAFRADNSPFDHYLRTGDPATLDPAARRGMAVFYGKGGCNQCHSGSFQTDHGFHAIAMPQIGPGKSHGTDNGYWNRTGFLERLEDWGRYGFTKKADDKFRFRTPSLRNVELTGPWGHDGAYRSLEAVVRHHLDPVTALHNFVMAESRLYDFANAIDRLSFEIIAPTRMHDYRRRAEWVHNAPRLRAAIAAANELQPRTLSDAEIADLVAFLRALTDPASRNLGHLIPDRVPSGLPVDQ